MDFEHFMHLALAEARSAGEDIPVGAVIVSESGRVLAASHNKREETADPTSHAEIEVIREVSAKLGSWRLDGLTLFTTLEPCMMCAGAIRESRIGKVVFGAWAPSVGWSTDFLRSGPAKEWPQVVGGVLERECEELLGSFFESKRARPRGSQGS